MDRISITIDCEEKDVPEHRLTVGSISCSYTNEADLADDLETLIESQGADLAA